MIAVRQRGGQHEESREQYERRVKAEVFQEALFEDRVHREVGYRAFTSKSKGLRYSKKRGWYQRSRRNWKEVELMRYCSGWHQPHRFRADEQATELMHERAGSEELLEHIRRFCGPDGGR